MKTKEVTFVDEQTPGTLIVAVAQILANNGLVNEANEVFLQSPVIAQACIADNKTQRNALNRFFYSQLASLDVPTQTPRYYLVPDCEIDQWFIFFSTKVLPYLVEYRLPKKDWK
jgi:hypothetical protein